MNLLSYYLEQLENRKMKYYAFDWDDNLQNTPTKIHLLKNGKLVDKFSTEEFVEHHQQVVDKYKIKFIDELGFKLYENLNLDSE